MWTFAKLGGGGLVVVKNVSNKADSLYGKQNSAN